MLRLIISTAVLALILPIAFPAVEATQGITADTVLAGTFYGIATGKMIGMMENAKAFSTDYPGIKVWYNNNVDQANERIDQHNDLMRQLYANEPNVTKVILPHFEKLANETANGQMAELSEPQESSCNWTGTWNTDFGLMELKQSGNIVTGSYYYAGGQIQGTASSNDIYGNWIQNNHKSGTFDFSMTADCKAFSGKWRYGTSGEWSGSWAGTRQ